MTPRETVPHTPAVSAGIVKGARVTGELPHYFDGSPAEHWPSPHYLGTVLRIDQWHGCTYARVKFDSGRTEWENVDRLFLVARAERRGKP